MVIISLIIFFENHYCISAAKCCLFSIPKLTQQVHEEILKKTCDYEVAYVLTITGTVRVTVPCAHTRTSDGTKKNHPGHRSFNDRWYGQARPYRATVPDGAEIQSRE
jgi:hypothetical protein